MPDINDTEKLLDNIMNEPVLKEEDKDREKKFTGATCSCASHDNVVDRDKYKMVQLDTLKRIAGLLANTYGPMGSFTEIILGSDPDTAQAKYSKDGLTVLKAICFDQPIEASIRESIEDICRYVEVNVGDATTSTSIIAYHVFKTLLDVENKFKVMPRTIMALFKKYVAECQEIIKSNARELTLDDVYNISMISTNGNTEISENIKSLYEKFGMDVDIDVEISDDVNNKTLEFDGIIMDAGFSDSAYINNKTNNTCSVPHAKVYYFTDPADNMRMISLFEKILIDNIMIPMRDKSSVNYGKPIPTVIMVPKLSRDSSAALNEVISLLYEYSARKMENQKPPVLVLTNYLGVEEGVAYDIARLCGCKEIKKYIDQEREKEDMEKGIAPTLDNIHDFAGECELVEASQVRTKFVNPKAAMEDPILHQGQIAFLETEIEQRTKNNDEPLKITRLKTRLRKLKANCVTYFVGGITISDRDSAKDLVIDAVKNCKSAAAHGVGKAANVEGLLASTEVLMRILEKTKGGRTLESEVARSIAYGYLRALETLYATAIPQDRLDKYVVDTLRSGFPVNISEYIDGKFEFPNPDKEGTNVLCSIMTDVYVLDAISRILTVMVTSNQCMLPAPNLNRY